MRVSMDPPLRKKKHGPPCQWTPPLERRNMAWAIDMGGGGWYRACTAQCNTQQCRTQGTNQSPRAQCPHGRPKRPNKANRLLYAPNHILPFLVGQRVVRFPCLNYPPPLAQAPPKAQKMTVSPGIACAKGAAVPLHSSPSTKGRRECSGDRGHTAGDKHEREPSVQHHRGSRGLVRSPCKSQNL